MDIGLLKKLFGTDQQWQGPCTIMLDANAAVFTNGTDAIGTGGLKSYAPRIVSGRMIAEAVCLLRDNSALLLLQQLRTKTATGEEVVRHTLVLADPEHVIGVEFTEATAIVLQKLGLAIPVTPSRSSGSHSGIQTKPKTMS